MDVLEILQRPDNLSDEVDWHNYVVKKLHQCCQRTSSKNEIGFGLVSDNGERIPLQGPYPDTIQIFIEVADRAIGFHSF